MRGSPNRRLVIAAFAALAAAGHPAVAAPTSPVGLRVVVDRRVELMSIVCRLAGYEEYRQGAVAHYAADVDRQFGPYKEHPVVARARRLRKERGVGYDAPMTLAVYMTGPPDMRMRAPLDPWPPRLDTRWTAAEIDGFLRDLRAFVRDSKFVEFADGHRALYDLSAQRLGQRLRDARVLEWFDGFFGARPKSDYTIALGLLNGGGNYGVSAQIGGKEDIYCILGIWQCDAGGMPVFGGVTETLVHEFCHSYVNAIVDANLDALRDAGKAIFAKLSQEMGSQAYGSWQTVMRESLVRACTVRYVRASGGPEAAEREVASQRGRHFLWVGALSELLGEYETDRARYPTLDRFMPRIARFFKEYTADGGFRADLTRFEEERRARIAAIAAKSPKIVSMSPANGATNVPADTREIVITFDRPMVKDNLALMRVAGATFPPRPAGARASFDEEGKVLTIPCSLEPGVEYGFGMNADNYLVMRDTSGNPLVPTEYRFRTAAR